MLRILGSPRRLCDGLARRDFIQAGMLGALGLSDWLWAQAVSAAPKAPVPGSFGKAKACILLYLYGSPSQLETFDVKPDAPVEISLFYGEPHEFLREESPGNLDRHAGLQGWVVDLSGERSSLTLRKRIKEMRPNDSWGVTGFAPLWPGRYVIALERDEPSVGELQGRKYDTISRRVTFSFLVEASR